MSIKDYFTDIQYHAAYAHTNKYTIKIVPDSGVLFDENTTYALNIIIGNDTNIIFNINFSANAFVNNASKHGLDFLNQYYGGVVTYFKVPANIIEKVIQVLSGGNLTETNVSGGVCAKCGNYDQYACAITKFNNEIRCYLHCQ